jgi:hypothetical protein
MSKPTDPFEDELREALRSGSEAAKTGDDDTDTLDRIHRGATRRRRRRRTGAVVAVAALTGTIVVGAPMLSPTPETHQTAKPSASTRTVQPTADQKGTAPERKRQVGAKGLMSDRAALAPGAAVDPAPPPAGEPVGVHDLQVMSVSGSAPEQFWVSGSGTCAGRTCNVLGVGHASDSGVDVQYRALPGSPRQVETAVRFSGDGQTGWATNGVATFSTADGGKDWTRLDQPKGVRVKALEAWGDEVWAVGDRASDTVVLANTDGSQQLTEVQEAPDLDPDQAVSLGPSSFGVTADTVDGEFLRTGDGGQHWDRGTIGCKPADVSATDGAVWALCGGPRPELVKSYDQGQTWGAAETLSVAASDRPYLVAAIDPETAFVASDSESWVVDRGVPQPVGGLDEGPYRYIGFTSRDVGYVVDGFGNLCRTDDGGYSWNPVDLP